MYIRSSPRRPNRDPNRTLSNKLLLLLFLYIVVYYRLVIYLLNNFIGLYTAKVPYYRGIIYKFKYLKS